MQNIISPLKIRWIKLSVGVLVIAAVWTCEARQLFGTRQQTSADTVSRAAIPPFKRKMQSWLIRNRSQSRISDTMKRRIQHSRTSGNKSSSGRPKQRGSFMTSTRPTKEQLYRWFGVEGEDPNQLMRGMMLRNEFNHNISGITNPFLKIQRSCRPQQQHDCHATEPSGSVLDNDGRIILKPITKMVDDTPTRNNRCYEKKVLSASRNMLRAGLALDSSTDVEKSWWPPSVQISENGDSEHDAILESSSRWRLLQRNRNGNGKNAKESSFRKQDWRILTFRKRVGRGKECYEKVRDAALDWEFQSIDGSTGMMQVPDACPTGNNLKLGTLSAISTNNKRSYSILPIDDDRAESARNPDTYSSSSSLYHSLGSRRLVSFASKSLTGILPPVLQRRIYSINPVMVVYDVVDQRAPDGQGTFTSTAYSTLKGHFLRGEERVTVALRDGSQDVEVEILSISRAGTGLLGKTLWPFIGKMQSTFFRQQLEHLSDSGRVVDAGTY